MHIFILLGYVWFLENARERKKILRKIIFSLDDMKNMMKKKGKENAKDNIKIFSTPLYFKISEENTRGREESLRKNLSSSILFFI